MKNPPTLRALGILFIILSSLGLLFSLSGIIGTWVIKPRIESGVLDLIHIFHDTLSTADEAIEILDGTIEDSITNLGLIETSFVNLGTTVESISSSVDASATLIGDDLRLTVIQTQIALSSAATSAEIIDNMLSFLASIPLLGANYQPDVPLHISLEQVAGSLDDIPDSLETIEESLTKTSAGLETFSTDLAVLAGNIDTLSEDLSGVQSVLDDYAIIVERALKRTETLESNLARNLIFLSIFISGMLLWLGVAQVNVFLQGLAYYQNEQQVVTLADLRRE